MPYTLQVIQEVTGGELTGNPEDVIVGVNTLQNAGPGELTFAEHKRYTSEVRLTGASAIIVDKQFPPMADKNLLRVMNPRVAFVKVMMMFQVRPSVPPGIDPTAVVSPKAFLGQEVAVGEHTVVRDLAHVGNGTIIDSGVHVGSGVVIGEHCVIGPNVVLIRGTKLGHRVIIHGGSVIGGDGFGYVWAEGRHVKIPQLGNVVIEDDVEIGSNVCVDRAMLGSTVIRRGTKIDNLVQIGHNNVVGQDVIIVGQVGLAGSVTVGDRVIIGGQAGVADHRTIGDDARVGAAAGVRKDVKRGESVLGTPSRPAHQVKREWVSVTQLPDLIRQSKELAGRMAQIESRLDLLERARPEASRD